MRALEAMVYLDIVSKFFLPITQINNFFDHTCDIMLLIFLIPGYEHWSDKKIEQKYTKVCHGIFLRIWRTCCLPELLPPAGRDIEVYARTNYSYDQLTTTHWQILKISKIAKQKFHRQ